jgi:FkbM family methyltransferase
MSIATGVFGLVPLGLVQLVLRNQQRSPLLRKVCKFGADRVRQKDGNIRHGIGKGIRFNVGSSQSSFMLGTHEPDVQQALADVLRPGMVMFDVGANVGFCAVLGARLVGPSGHVVCFEPVPGNAKQIEYNAALNQFSQLKTRHEALGASDGRASFRQSVEPTWGNLGSVGRVPDKYKGEIQVSVRRLDSIMATERLPTPDLIKIDVEGAEADVLNGAARTIMSMRPALLIELHGTNAPIAAALEEFGYEAIALGHKEPITSAPWYAYAFAAPIERPELVKVVRNLSVAP